MELQGKNEKTEDIQSLITMNKNMIKTINMGWFGFTASLLTVYVKCPSVKSYVTIRTYRNKALFSLIMFKTFVCNIINISGHVARIHFEPGLYTVRGTAQSQQTD